MKSTGCWPKPWRRGQLVKAAQKLEWGGYGGYFADPDGHLWEVAMNPFWPLDEEGQDHAAGLMAVTSNTVQPQSMQGRPGHAAAA